MLGDFLDREKQTDHSSSSSYSQQWDLNSRHESSAAPTETLSASQAILESLKKRRGTETAQWLNSLHSDNSKNSPVISQQGLNPVTHQMSPEERTQAELIKWLDKLFDQFDLYSARFNATAQGTDLVVTCTRPVMDKPSNNQLELYSEPEQVVPIEQAYEGHLVTRFWAMYLRGSSGNVSVFVIPAEALLGFSLRKIDESTYSPLMVIESQWNNEQLAWHIAGTTIVINQVPMLAKELFGDLIRVASGQMSEDELFAHPLQEMNLGENIAVGYKVPTPAVQPVAAAQSSPVGQSPAPSIAALPNTSTFSLSSLNVAQQMLAAMEADINQLFQLGKAALAEDNTTDFQKIKTLTEKMETLKATIKSTFAEIAQTMQSKVGK